MANDPDEADGGAFTPLDRFVMELFRTISPNRGQPAPRRMTSQPARTAELSQHRSRPTRPTSMDPRHWTNPTEFDPDRYQTAPTSADNDEARCQAAGLARCPFPHESFPVKDGRAGELTNSVFGAVYGVVDGTAVPGLRHGRLCALRLRLSPLRWGVLTVAFIKEFLRAAWQRGISFERLDLERPEKVPVGPGTVLDDDIAFAGAT